MTQPIIYIDLDGVLADLYGHAQRHLDVEHYSMITDAEFNKWFADANAEELFASLNPFPTNKKLLSYVKNLAGSFNILSSPLNFDREGSIRGKRHWLATYVKDGPKEAIFEHRKYLYAKQPNGTPNILIDDFGKNTALWEEHGGIAIKYQADKDELFLTMEAIGLAYVKICLTSQ